MAAKEEEVQETDELDDKFVTLVEDEDGYGIIRYESSTRVLVYTGEKARSGHFFKRAIPIAAFVDLAREVLKKVEAGELEVD